MNKRQAKKKFKKKYGVTPAEMADNICKTLSNFVPIVINTCSHVIDMLNDLGDSIQSEDFEKIAQAIMEDKIED